jgi:hypothetical protein
MDMAQLLKWRFVILVELGLFCLSVTLLLWAGSAPQRIPEGQVTWQGVLDVVTAFAVVIIGMWIYVKGRDSITDPNRQTSYIIATTLPAVMFLAMWFFLDKIRCWDILLVGRMAGIRLVADSPGRNCHVEPAAGQALGYFDE